MKDHNNKQGSLLDALSLSPKMLAYPLPQIMVAFLFGPMAIVQGIYAKYFGLSLTTIAAVLLIGRLFDAVTDPLIGYFSDRYYARTGSRKPFVAAGAILFVCSSYFLYAPPSNVVSPIYFLGWFLAFYFSVTLFSIPHMAWGNELVSHANEKNMIFSLRMLADFLGKTLFYAVPLLPFFATTEFTPETLRWSVVIAALIMAPLLFICMRFAPRGRPPVSGTDGKDRHGAGMSPWLVLRALRRNKPFLLFIAAFGFGALGAGMWYGLMFIYSDVYLNLGDKLPQLFLFSVGVSILSLGIWWKLANRFGKKIICCCGSAIYIVALLGISMLSPDQGSFIPLMVMKLLIYVSLGATGITAPSLLADIIDYGALKSGQDVGGIYFAVQMFLVKTLAAISAAAGLAIAGWYGFDAAADVHTPQGVFGLRLGAIYLPIIFLALGVYFMIRIPINTRRHGIIRKRLDIRMAWASAGVNDTPG